MAYLNRFDSGRLLKTGIRMPKTRWLVRLRSRIRSYRPDTRRYTLMVIPHHGKTVFSLRIPIRLVKVALLLSGLAGLYLAGVLLDYRSALETASRERAELQNLREVNARQHQQIEQLAKSTASLQADMGRLNQLDAELRRLISTDELPAVSRGGIVRPGVNSGGQGGPVLNADAGTLIKTVQDLTLQAKARESSLNELRDALIARNQRLAATPSIPPAQGEITSPFGWRASPWGWGGDWHPGVDIANSYGTPIVATADGTVVFSSWNSGGYGNMIKIDHGNGIETVYAHNSQNLVSVGEHVKKGQVIAYMGNTGASTGPHVHYEVHVNGKLVNPANFF